MPGFELYALQTSVAPAYVDSPWRRVFANRVGSSQLNFKGNQNFEVLVETLSSLPHAFAMGGWGGDGSGISYMPKMRGGLRTTLKYHRYFKV